ALPQIQQPVGRRQGRGRQLGQLRQRIGEFQPLGRACGAVHAALFMDNQGTIRLGREDIGRHNALDKLIG
ncbi:formate dehydrogenase accessory sulfurtransferase FdhD, partial [Stutzerimonas stutzeri]|uniref:formate dehydrogenase accessory sulfurtransferase FdhD n=1 Tax=Stutzerimonas stutzeri TaxID=316 RepID=UPI0024B81ABB